MTKTLLHNAPAIFCEYPTEHSRPNERLKTRLGCFVLVWCIREIRREGELCPANVIDDRSGGFRGKDPLLTKRFRVVKRRTVTEEMCNDQLHG